MAPLTMPSWPSNSAICQSIGYESGLVLPGALLDLHHHAGPLVEAEVIGGRHVEDAMSAGDILDLLERFFQLGATWSLSGGDGSILQAGMNKLGKSYAEIDARVQSARTGKAAQ